MKSEARSLLDDQISVLRDLGSAAELTYRSLAAIPAMIRSGNSDVELIANGLVSLATEKYEHLDSCLDRAEHWLQPTKPVYVPVPWAEAEYPSACSGAAHLLMTFDILLRLEAGEPDRPLEASNELGATLADRWREDGYPKWLTSAPVEALGRAADAAVAEVNRAIERLTERFLVAQSCNDGLATDPRPQSPPTLVRASDTMASSVDVPRRPRQLKRSTERGEARAKWIAALLKHHKYDDCSCLIHEPIGVRRLAHLAGISVSRTSDLFEKEFKL